MLELFGNIITYIWTGGILTAIGLGAYAIFKLLLILNKRKNKNKIK